MDHDRDSTVRSAKEAHSNKQFIKILVPLSLLSISVCHVLGFSFFSPYPSDLRFSTFIFPLVAYALDRKFMFLICNGILAFLAKNLSFSSSSPGFLYNGDSKKFSEPAGVEEVTVEDHEAYVEYPASDNVAVLEEKKQEETHGSFCRETGERISEVLIAESEEDFDEVEVGTTIDGVSPVEERNYANVNTDELNKKIEEFIKKMKEEIRIEAQQLVECN